MGKTIGYFVGRRSGRRMLEGAIGSFLSAEHLAREEAFLLRLDGRGVLTGASPQRFVRSARTRRMSRMSGMSCRVSSTYSAIRARFGRAASCWPVHGRKQLASLFMFAVTVLALRCDGVAPSNPVALERETEFLGRSSLVRFRRADRNLAQQRNFRSWSSWGVRGEVESSGVCERVELGPGAGVSEYEPPEEDADESNHLGSKHIVVRRVKVVGAVDEDKKARATGGAVQLLAACEPRNVIRSSVDREPWACPARNPGARHERLVAGDRYNSTNPSIDATRVKGDGRCGDRAVALPDHGDASRVDRMV